MQDPPKTLESETNGHVTQFTKTISEPQDDHHAPSTGQLHHLCQDNCYLHGHNPEKFHRCMLHQGTTVSQLL